MSFVDLAVNLWHIIAPAAAIGRVTVADDGNESNVLVCPISVPQLAPGMTTPHLSVQGQQVDYPFD